MSANQERRARRERARQRQIAQVMQPDKMHHGLSSAERAFLGRTWKAADDARTNMSDEKQAALDQFRVAVQTI